jgi:CBS domain-containing protein
MKTAETILREKNRPILAVSADTPVLTAVQTMVDNKVGAILVKGDDEIIGMWTERDLLRNTLIPGFDPATSPIGRYMMEGIDLVTHDVSVNELFNTFIEHKTRHLLVKRYNKFIGLLSVHDAIKAYYDELRSYVTIQFYEKPLPNFDKQK